MVFDILILAACLIMVVMIVFDAKKQDKTYDRLAKLAMKVAELEDTIHMVDESTGRDLHALRDELRDYQSLYGEAAVEAERQKARAEKAWADGVNSIMSYGAQYQRKDD